MKKPMKKKNTVKETKSKPVKAKVKPPQKGGYARYDTNWKKLHLAAWGNRLEAVKKLISDGADLNAATTQGQTPLHLAAKKGWQDVALFLVKEGADVNPKNQDGWTPLHEAAFNGKGEIIKLLVDSGADLYAKDEDGVTPLQVANDTCKPLLKKIQEELQKTGLLPPDENKTAVQKASVSVYGVIDQLQKARDEAGPVEKLVLKSLLDQAESLEKNICYLLSAQQDEKSGFRF
jgi:hypothetical protein